MYISRQENTKTTETQTACIRKARKSHQTWVRDQKSQWSEIRSKDIGSTDWSLITDWFRSTHICAYSTMAYSSWIGSNKLRILLTNGLMALIISPTTQSYLATWSMCKLMLYNCWRNGLLVHHCNICRVPSLNSKGTNSVAGHIQNSAEWMGYRVDGLQSGWATEWMGYRVNGQQSGWATECLLQSFYLLLVSSGV